MYDCQKLIVEHFPNLEIIQFTVTANKCILIRKSFETVLF